MKAARFAVVLFVLVLFAVSFSAPGARELRRQAITYAVSLSSSVDHSMIGFGNKGKVEIWTCDFSRKIKDLEAPEIDGLTIDTVSFSDDSKSVAASVMRRNPQLVKEIYIWNIETGQLAGKLLALPWTISFQFVASDLIAFGDASDKLQIYDWKKSRIVFQEHFGLGQNSWAIQAQKKILIVGDTRGGSSFHQLSVFQFSNDFSSLTQVGGLFHQSYDAGVLAIARKSDLLVVASSVGPATLWDYRSRRFLHSLFHPTQADLISAVFSPDERTVVLGDWMGNLHFYSTETGQWLGSETAAERGIRGIVFSNDGTRVLANSDAGDIREFDLHPPAPFSYDILHSLDSTESTISVDSQNGEVSAIVGTNKTQIRFFSMKTHEITARMTGMGLHMGAFELISDGTLLAVDEVPTIYSIPDAGSIAAVSLRKYPGHNKEAITAFAFHAGRQMVASADRSALHIWNVNDLTMIAKESVSSFVTNIYADPYHPVFILRHLKGEALSAYDFDKKQMIALISVKEIPSQRGIAFTRDGFWSVHTDGKMQYAGSKYTPIHILEVRLYQIAGGEFKITKTVRISAPADLSSSCAAISSDSKFLAVCAGNDMKIIDLKNLTLTAKFTRPTDLLTSGYFIDAKFYEMPGDRGFYRLASIDGQGRIVLWKADLQPTIVTPF